MRSSAAIRYIDISTILPPAHDSSVWMNSNIKQCWAVVNNRGHLVLGKVQSAWQQDCRHSPFAAMYFCLPPPINTMSRAYFELSRPTSVVSQYVRLNIIPKLTKKTEHCRYPLPYKLNLCLSHSISARLWDNIWCIRLWMSVSAVPRTTSASTVIVVATQGFRAD